jgi:predicted MFS family arabinose efflux permease
MIAGGAFGGGTASLVYTRPVIANFKQQRGLALGLSIAGTSIAAIFAPPLLSAMIGEFGWRAGFFTMAVLTGLIGMPLALVLIGRARERAVHLADEIDAVNVRDVSLREAARGARFWLLIVAIVCINVPGAGVLGQLAPLVADTGLADPQVAIIMSIYSIGLLFGRVLTGFALDHIPAWIVGAVTTLIPAIGILMLMAPEPSFTLTAIAVALVGLQQGAETDLFAYVISHSFGIKHYGSIFGTVLTAGAFSTAVALVLFGEVHDATGSYDLALTIGAVLFCAGALAFAAIARSAGPQAPSAQAAQS